MSDMERAKKMHEEYTKSLREWEKCYQLYRWSQWAYSSSQFHNYQKIQNRNTAQNVNQPGRIQDNNNATVPVVHTTGAMMCSTAPVSLRFFAELADAIILVVFKSLSIVILAEIFNIDDVELSLRFIVIDNNLTDEITTEELQYMLVVGLLYRLLTCMYETLFLHYRGATPGKTIFGIEVVDCQRCMRRENSSDDMIVVVTGSKASLYNSWLRSVVKNFSMAFMIPAFLTMLFYRNRRTSYDIISKTIVIKRNA